jgi:hypothetical protein
MTQILLVPWIFYIIFVPGFLIITLLHRRGELDFSFFETILFSLAAGLLYIALIGYLLDFCSCFTFFNITVLTTFFNIMVIFFTRVYLGEYLRNRQPISGTFRKKDLLFFLGLQVLLVFIAFLVLWAPLSNVFIYPSDPVNFLFRGRYLTTESQLVLLIREASQGSAMTYPLGFDYLLASLFSFNLSNSYDIVRFLGPVFGILSILSIYTLTNRVTNSKASSILAALFAGTNYMWVWFRKLSVPNGTVEFIIPILFLSIYFLFKNNNHKKLKALYILIPILACAVFIYHPPTLLIFLIPTLVWFVIFGRKFVSKGSIFKMLILLLVFTSPFWILLNQSSFGQRLDYSATNVVQPQPTYLSIEYLLRPFDDYWSYAPLIPLAFSLVGYVYRKIKEKNNKSSLYVYEILLFTFISQYFLWISPIPVLRSFFLNQYNIARMPLHLSLAGSVLVGYGFKELISFLKRYKLSIFVDKKKGEAKSQSNIISFRRFGGLSLIILVIVTPIILQVNWGFTKFEGNIFHSNISEGSALMVHWIDNNIPMNVTILFDENNTPLLKDTLEDRLAKENLFIEGEVAKFWFTYTMLKELAGSLNERGPVYLSYASLYPRNIIGFEDLFNNTKTNEIDTIIKYVIENDVNYIALTNPKNWSNLLAPLKEFSELIYTADEVLLYRVDFRRLELEFNDLVYDEQVN